MKKDNIIWGILLVLCGVVLIVSKLGICGNIDAFALVITILCVYVIIKSIFEVSFGGVLFPLAFIGIVYAKPLGITAITPWTILVAALLGTIGLNLIFHKHHHHAYIEHHMDDSDFKVIDVEDESNVKCDTSFGASTKYINTDDFKQADLDISFGALKVYFDHATIQGKQAIVSLDASFAGVELYIPKEWNVDNQLNLSIAGVQEKNRSQSTGEPVLKLIGSVKFAGVDIFYV